MLGQSRGGGVVEDDGRREPQAGGAHEPVAQLDRGERVEAELLEGPLGLDLGGGGVAEHRGDLGADQVEDVALALWLGQGGERVASEPRRRRGAWRDADQAAEDRRQAPMGGLGAQRGAIERAPRTQVGAVRRQGGVEELQAPARRRAARCRGARIRARSASLSPPAMPLSAPQRPQAIEVAGRPSARRFWASASRKALAAA